jgi:hypothetical protein
MGIEYCDTCGEIDWLDGKHRCPPMFYFYHESWGENGGKLRAWTFEEAARKWGALYNEDGDYALMGEYEEVKISDGATEKIFKVTAETSIEYTAFEKREADNG